MRPNVILLDKLETWWLPESDKEALCNSKDIGEKSVSHQESHVHGQQRMTDLELGRLIQVVEQRQDEAAVCVNPRAQKVELLIRSKYRGRFPVDAKQRGPTDAASKAAPWGRCGQGGHKPESYVTNILPDAVIPEVNL